LRAWLAEACDRKYGAFMVSIDHFRYELISQLRRVAEDGATTIVITSRDLCQSIRNASHSTQACCEAMKTEMKDGDVLIDERSGVGMSVRYSSPRS
jgi:hypothetical protein